MGRRAKNELGALARAARAQIARATELGKSIDARMKLKMAASPEWTPDEDFRRDFAAITNTLQHAGNAMTRALEGNKKNTDGLSEAQLEAQFAAEIVRSAQSMTDEEWATMCEARAKAGR
jgi:hypothetical protein